MNATPSAQDQGTYYIDKYYEKQWNGVARNHYFLGNINLAVDILSGTNSGVYYVLSDHLGSSSLTTNPFGNMIDRTEYAPYGSIVATAATQNIGNNYKFTGKEADAENNLQYFGARYYDNRVGRFTAIDPYGLQSDKIIKVLSDPQQLNGYSYSRNNPIILVDADGNTPAEYLGGYVVGLGQAVGNFAVGTVESIVHPVEAVKSIGNTLKAGGEGAVSLVRDIAANPKQVASEIKAGASMSYNEFMDKPDYEKGKVVGNAVANTAIAVEGTGAVGELKIGGSLSKISETTSKIKDVIANKANHNPIVRIGEGYIRKGAEEKQFRVAIGNKDSWIHMHIHSENLLNPGKWIQKLFDKKKYD